MEEKLKESLSREIKGLEDVVFFWSLIASLLFLTYVFVFGLISNSPLYSIIQDGILAGIILGLIFYINKYNDRQYIIRLAYCVASHSLIHINWIIWNGYEGHMPMIYIALCVITLLILPVKRSLLVITTSVLANIFLIAAQNEGVVVIPNYVSEFNISITYLIMCIAIVFMISKTKSVYEQQQLFLRTKNQELNEINVSLNNQLQELQANKDAINVLNNDLIQNVEQRTQEVIDKGAELEEMAFVNAHLLRAPLARLLGIIEIMEIDKHPAGVHGQMAEIRESAAHADYIIRHINQVTSNH